MVQCARLATKLLLRWDDDFTDYGPVMKDFEEKKVKLVPRAQELKQELKGAEDKVNGVEDKPAS